jgi:hypothetical protein
MAQGKWKTIKWSSGCLSLYLDKRLRKSYRRRPLDIVAIDRVMTYLIARPKLPGFSPAKRRQYSVLVGEARYWHGTGILQYGKDGQIIKVLERILQQGSMRPFKDNFDAKHGEVVSISLARHRMYARIYADMHVYRGAKLTERYGSPRFWAYYFIIATNIHAIKELGLWNPKARRKQETAWREQGKRLWTVKVAKNAGSSGGKFFDQGSDITGNFGVLIGIKPADYTVLKTAAYVARYESRIGSVIPVTAFTHLEVPLAKVAETKALLRQYGYGNLPVFAFEHAEQFHADKHFSKLVAQRKS